MSKGVASPFYTHVQEFRRRLFWTALVFLGGAGAGYFFRLPLTKVLNQPIAQPLFYTSPSGGFDFYVKISLAVGLMAAIPAILYHLVRFIDPAFERKIHGRHLSLLVLLSFTLMLAGMAFAWFVVLPMSLHFFSSYNSHFLNPLISGTEYLAFIINMLVTFALIFQLPLLLLSVNWITPIKPRKLLKFQRYVIVGSLIIAVILPFTYDPITQFVIALPIIGLYEFSVLLIWMVNRRPKYNFDAFPNYLPQDNLKLAGPEPATVFVDLPTLAPPAKISHPVPSRVLDLRSPQRNYAA